MTIVTLKHDCNYHDNYHLLIFGFVNLPHQVDSCVDSWVVSITRVIPVYQVPPKKSQNEVIGYPLRGAPAAKNAHISQ